MWGKKTNETKWGAAADELKYTIAILRSYIYFFACLY